jgi:hypothetical protein
MAGVVLLDDEAVLFALFRLACRLGRLVEAAFFIVFFQSARDMLLI